MLDQVLKFLAFAFIAFGIVTLAMFVIAWVYFNHVLPWRMSRHLRKGRKW